MRKQFVTTVEEVLSSDENTALLLGDISVFGFRNSFKNYPTRVYNIGILEQATVSLSAGLSKVGINPIVHTIAPFLVERCFEQLKVDFGYQKLNGNFVSIGASYDYAALGCTHHCPGDVHVLKSIPGMQIVVPGNSREFDSLFKQCYNNGSPTYYRLSENEHEENFEVTFGKANLLKKGNKATVVVIGPMLKNVLEATKNLDITLIYYSTVEPFDRETLVDNMTNNKIVICEPYYEGSVTNDIVKSLSPMPISFEFVSIEKQFLSNYGTFSNHEEALGLSPDKICEKIKKFINE